MVWLVFMDWAISWTNEWEDYSSYFGEGAEIFRNWATAHFFFFTLNFFGVYLLYNVVLVSDIMALLLIFQDI